MPGHAAKCVRPYSIVQRAEVVGAGIRMLCYQGIVTPRAGAMQYRIVRIAIQYELLLCELCEPPS